ncbi:PLP-dependent aminotransferase family protein [Roseateles sp. NT4]|uniref:MocR-like pyridoxine biosynthesis transcription factor PdxR n=1 Tax=Roseateles sp. NT4 TaxID=3453715 RepID=UPI003EE9BB6E
MLAAESRSRALYEELKARIRDGTHAPGQVLPSTRACAAERGLSRTTVSAVYEQLAAEGFIETRPGAASRVAAGAGSPARAASLASSKATAPRLSALGERLQQRPVFDFGNPPARAIDFAYGPLSAGDFPALAWRKAVRATEKAPDASLTYREPLGDLSLRRALQGYLARSRGIACSVEQLVVANGSQQVLDLCARLLLDPGDAVAVEDPGYGMANRAFEAAGARLVGVPVDDHGLVTDALPRAATRLAYVTPTHQFPLGGFLPMARRHALLAWAHAQGAWVIEDDYDAEYRHALRPELTLRSLDPHDRVIYVGTFSKTLSPELRLGYAVLPAGLAGPFAQVRQLADRHAPTGPQRALARLIADGGYERHVRRIRRAQQTRRVALLDALARHLPGRVRVQGSASGLHVVAWLDEVPAAHEAALVEAAKRAGVWVYPLGPLYLAPAPAERERVAGLVMGYALLGVDEITRGVRKLVAVLDAMPGLVR